MTVTHGWYVAFWQNDHSKIIFRNTPAAKVRARLPEGAKVVVSDYSTIGCGSGDEYEFALFEVGGEQIVVMPDPRKGFQDGSAGV